MPGIDIDRLEAGVPDLRRGRSLLDGNYAADCPLRDFKKLYDQFLSMTENCLFELKEQRNTIASRDREIADLKRRLAETGAFVP